MRRITVVVADEQPLFRRGVRWSLERESDILVVGEAADLPAAVALVDRYRPAVALLQRDLPAADTASGALALAERQPGTRVILLAAGDRASGAASAGRAQPWPSVPKSIEPDALASLIRRVAAGDPSVVEDAPWADEDPARGGDNADGRRGRSVAPSAHGVPTDRELRILALIAHGESNREIAASLAISEQTVKNGVSSILRKLAAGDRTQAVIAALRAGWIDLDTEGVGRLEPGAGS